MTDEVIEVLQGDNVMVTLGDPNQGIDKMGLIDNAYSYYAEWTGPMELEPSKRVRIKTKEEGRHRSELGGNIVLYAPLELEQLPGTYKLTKFEIRQGWAIGRQCEWSDRDDMPLRYRTVHVSARPRVEPPKRHWPETRPPS
jgi:hypothetical protein